MILSVPSSALKGCRFPHSVIGYAVWTYHRFALRLRDVEDLPADYGIEVSYETIGHLMTKFGPQIAAKIRRHRTQHANKWHLNEVAITIGWKKHWLWHAVDSNRDTLEILVPSRPNANAAKTVLAETHEALGPTSGHRH